MRFSLQDRVVAGLVCSVVAGQPVFGASNSGAGKTAQIQGDARVLHALNRFTFGPRYGDVAAVRSMGLDRWFEQQLNPASIDDSALDARLAPFPAMRLGQAELMAKFPNAAVIRAMVKNGDPLPGDPLARAIYGDQIEFYKMKIAAKEESGSSKTAVDGAAGAEAKAQNDGADPLSVTPVEHSGALYSREATNGILGLAPDARYAAVLGMAPKELAAFEGV